MQKERIKADTAVLLTAEGKSVSITGIAGAIPACCFALITASQAEQRILMQIHSMLQLQSASEEQQMLASQLHSVMQVHSILSATPTEAERKETAKHSVNM
jgi:hypothetical protein